MKSLPHCRSRQMFLFFVFMLGLAPGCGQKPVATAATEDEANEMIDVLRENGFDVEKEELTDQNDRKSWKVMVDDGWFSSGNTAYAVRVLRDNGLPRPTDKGLEGAYEERGMFPSESAQKAQRMKELKTEIERQIRLLPGVTRVSVLIVPPEDKTLNFDPYAATASVVIIHKTPEPSFTVADIQQLVSKGVPNLKPENISVSIKPQLVRELPRRDMEIQRRNKLLIAAATGLAVVLGAVLVILALQSRQQKRKIESLRRTREEEEEDIIDIDDENATVREAPPGEPGRRSSWP